MAADPQPYASPLRRRAFRLYFAGNLVSNVGNWLNNVVLAVFVHEQTGSSFWVGLVNFGLFMPVLAFALPAGALADRSSRVHLLRNAQLWSGALAVVLTVMAANGTATPLAITAIAFGMGIGVAVAIPVMQSLIPILVPPEELGDAIRLNGLTFNLARVAGPVLAAAALVTIGPVWAFGINAVSFLALAAALHRIGEPPFPRAHSERPGTVTDGIAYAWRHLRTRWMLLAIVAIGIALDPITTLSPALSVRYGLDADAAGWIVAAWGGGAAAMLIVGRRVIAAVTHHGLGWLGLLGLAAGVSGLGLAPGIGVALPSGVVAGAGYIVATMAFTTAIQSDVPEHLRGRISALWTLAFLGPRAIVAVADGALADLLGPRTATLCFAAVALVAAIALRHVTPSTEEPVAPPA